MLKTQIQIPHLSLFQYNSPFEDNHLLLKYSKEKNLILFDLGDISRVPMKDLLKVRYVFITHFHMDHIIGFHFFLRMIIKRTKDPITFFGTKGIIEKLTHAIQSYEWNLLDQNCCFFEIYEVHNDHLKYIAPCPFYLLNGDYIKAHTKTLNASDTLLKTDLFKVTYCVLDHKIPVLGFKLTLNPLFKVNPALLERFEAGSWIKELQILLKEESLSSSLYTLPDGSQKTLSEIKTTFFDPTPSYSLAYLTDFIFNESNLSVLKSFLKPQDQMMIESHFLSQDQNLAHKTYHLTTKDVAIIAKECGISHAQLIHFSQRYLKSHKVKDFYQELLFWYQKA